VPAPQPIGKNKNYRWLKQELNRKLLAINASLSSEFRKTFLLAQPNRARKKQNTLKINILLSI
jgi:hypothetical protein